MIKQLKSNKSLVLVLLCLLIFIFSFLIHWYPIYKKGYPPSINAEAIVLARNLTLTGEYMSQNKIGEVLASSLIKEQGDYSIEGNKLTVIIYSYIFKWFGYNQNIPLYFCLILFSLSSVILFIIAYKLFNFTIALLQTLIFNLFPITSYAAVYFGFYEWSFFFFCLGLFFYLYFKKEEKFRYVTLFLAGIFFALATLARNAFLISVLLIIIYEFFKYKNFRKVIIFSLPLIIGWFLYLAPDYLGNRVNSYISHSQDRFATYGHLFPDPYTFYFEKENFLKSFSAENARDVVFLTLLGKPSGLKGKVIVFFGSFTFYLKEIFKMVILGGPIIILFIILGIKNILEKNKEFGKFILFWILGWYFFVVFLRTQNWDHFLEISFPLSIAIALGVYFVIEQIMSERLSLLKNKKFWTILFVIALTGHLIYANKWMYHEEYDTSNIGKFKKIADCVNNLKIENNATIAVDLHPETPDHLNLFTDKSYIRFDLTTIERLLKENKIKEAFAYYNVKYIAGFPSELSKLIQKQYDITNIISDCLIE